MHGGCICITYLHNRQAAAASSKKPVPPPMNKKNFSFALFSVALPVLISSNIDGPVSIVVVAVVLVSVVVLIIVVVVVFMRLLFFVGFLIGTVKENMTFTIA